VSVNYNDNSGQNSSFGGSLLTANSTPAFTDAAIASWSYLSEAMLFVVEINDELKAVLNVDVSDFADLAVGSAKALHAARELGISGTGYIKEKGGRLYFILKGAAGSRQSITGTRYLVSNPRVADFAQSAGSTLKGAAKFNAVTIFISVAIETWADIVSDNDPKLSEILGSVTNNIIKACVTTFVAIGLFATLPAGLSVAGAVVLVAVVSFAVGGAYNYASNRLQIEEKLTAYYQTKIEAAERVAGQYHRDNDYLTGLIVEGNTNQFMRRLRRLFGN